MLPTFAAQIALIGNLLNANKEKRQRIFENEINNPMWQVISIINNVRADPLVLTSVCYLVLQLFKQEAIYQD